MDLPPPPPSPPLILLAGEIPLPPDEIPLPPDEEIPLPLGDEIPLPPDDDVQQSSEIISEPTLSSTRKRPHSPLQLQLQLQEPRLTKKSRLEAAQQKARSKKSKSRKKKTLGDDEDEEPEPMTEEQIIMARLMGFSSFNSTKGKMVPDNQKIGAVHVVKKQRCRQYMNRKGGFNRPLDKTS